MTVTILRNYMTFSGEKDYYKARKSKDDTFNQFNKKYYKEIEDYDWVKTTRSIIGLESIYHRLRERTGLKYINPNLKPNIQILDAGCGTGLLLQHLPKGSIGVDLNPRHVRKARINAPGKKVLLADVEAMPFNKSSFDIIICFETMEHLLFPEKALFNFKKTLKRNGVFIGSVPCNSLLWKLRIFSSTHPHSEPFHREFNQKDLYRLLTKYFRKVTINREIFGMNLYFTCTNNV